MWGYWCQLHLYAGAVGLCVVAPLNRGGPPSVALKRPLSCTGPSRTPCWCREPWAATLAAAPASSRATGPWDVKDDVQGDTRGEKKKAQWVR